MAAIEDVRPLGAELERSYQVYVRGTLKFRVKQIVYVAFSLDESVMGFAFPKEEREALVLSEPHKFQMPTPLDMRFNWVHADLASIGPDRSLRARRRRLAHGRPQEALGRLRLDSSHRPGFKPGLRDDSGWLGRLCRRLPTVGRRQWVIEWRLRRACLRNYRSPGRMTLPDALRATRTGASAASAGGPILTVWATPVSTDVSSASQGQLVHGQCQPTATALERAISEQSRTRESARTWPGMRGGRGSRRVSPKSISGRRR